MVTSIAYFFIGLFLGGALALLGIYLEDWWK
jgi:hypothetical protein